MGMQGVDEFSKALPVREKPSSLVNKSGFTPDSYSTPTTIEHKNAKLYNVSDLGGSPDTGYQSEEKYTPEIISSSEKATKLNLESTEEFVTPKFRNSYDYNTFDSNVLKKRKRNMKSQRLFNATDSPDSITSKLLEDLTKKPNQTMGILLVVIIIASAFFTICRLNAIQLDRLSAGEGFNDQLKDRSWKPSTIEGARNGKYASIEYAHEKRSKDQLRIVDENGNLLGGKKASIQFAYDLNKQKAEQASEIKSNKEMSDQVAENKKISETEKRAQKGEALDSGNAIDDYEEDFYDSLQLLDDLKKMGDLLKENSVESVEKNIQASLSEGKLKTLRPFGHFSSSKLRPLELDYEKSRNSIVSEPKKDENANEDNVKKAPVVNEGSLDSDAMKIEGKEGAESMPESIQSRPILQKEPHELNSAKKRNKSFNKLYKAYSEKILRLIEKKKAKKIQKSTSNGKSIDDEEDPFRFV